MCFLGVIKVREFLFSERSVFAEPRTSRDRESVFRSDGR